jgi:peptide deformylase
MAILRVARMGNPVLRQAAEPIDVDDLMGDEVQVLIEDMLDTVDDYQGIGLAAPQVHVSSRIIVVCPPNGDREDGEEELPPLALVNPEVTPCGEEKVTDWEGCLSIPDIRGRVPRNAAIEVTALNREGTQKKFRAEGYLARIIQHEVDHLDGVLFLDRMPDLQSLCFLSEYGRDEEESA